MVCEESYESTGQQSFHCPLKKWIIELNLSPHAFHYKMQRFWVVPKQIPMIRDFKSMPSTVFHPLFVVHLVKKATTDPREVISKTLFEILHSDLFFKWNGNYNQTLSKICVFFLGLIGMLTYNQNEAKPIMKRVPTLFYTMKKAY